VRRGGNRRQSPEHVCGKGECRICGKQVMLSSHKCFIQCIPEKEDQPKTKRVNRDQVNGRPFKEPSADDSDRRAVVDRDPPPQVCADYEATVDQEGVQSPILLCAETDEEDQEVSFYGPDCTTQFFYWLEEIAMDQDWDDRGFIVIFHNLKGYDGMFLLDYCYHHHREVTRQIIIGTKILSFKTDRLTFKDSLCFLPVPLANFPATFGIQELTKAFFPHLFNTLDNQEYRGPMPPASSYDPDGVSAKKKIRIRAMVCRQGPQ